MVKESLKWGKILLAFIGVMGVWPCTLKADDTIFQDRMAEILADEEATNQLLEFVKDRILSEKAGNTLLAVVSFCRNEKPTKKDRKTCLIRHLFHPQFSREELKK